jgi:long-subunit acyl-CoA synthetase (AMP-forming)
MQVDPAVGDLRVVAKTLLTHISEAEAHLKALEAEEQAQAEATGDLRAQAASAVQALIPLRGAREASASRQVQSLQQLAKLELEDRELERELGQLTHTASLLARVLRDEHP